MLAIVAAVTVLIAGSVTAGPRSILVRGPAPQNATLEHDFRELDIRQWDVDDPLGECERLMRAGAEFAVPDGIVSVDAIPSDSLFPLQHQHLNTGQYGGCQDCDMDTPEAWDIFTGDSTLVVGVIDTGSQVNQGFGGFGTHPDMLKNTWINPGEIAANGIDDEGNGYIDDVYGWDFGSNDNLPHDSNGHGTYIAGVIGADGNNNGRGVAGVAWRVKLMTIKFTYSNENWGYISDVVRGLNYARMMGVRLTNNSYSATTNDPALQAAVAACTAAGMLTVASAGNRALDMDCCPTHCNSYPAGYPDAGVVSVGAADDRDLVAGFSNYGAQSVDFFAPGVYVWSTYKASGYTFATGTSPAAACATGVAALVWGMNPNLSAAEVKARLMAGVDLKPAFAGMCITGGRLNAKLALSPPTTSVTQSSAVPMPASGSYDLQGRRIEQSGRSGVTFAPGRKRITVR